MFITVWNGYWYLAVTILWIAIATDVLDGYLARKFDQVSPIGGTLDHGSDALFVTLTLAAHTNHDYAPLALVLIIPVAFTQYLLDSDSLAGKPLRASQLGRYNGISYFVFAGWPIMQKTLGLTVIPFDLFIWIGWGLVLTTVISMIDRLVTLVTNKTEHRKADE